MGAAKWKVAGTLPEIYDQVFVPGAMSKWADFLVDLAEPRPGMRILDAACGTGAVTHRIAGHAGNNARVVGYDISPEMMAIAQAKPTNSAIEWQLGDVSSLPFLDEAFDVVVCQFGFMFFEDRVKSLKEMHRVLAAQGQLLVLVWGAVDRNPGFLAVAEGFGRHVSADAGNSIRGSFVLGDSHQMRTIAASAGFQDAIVKEVTTHAHFPSVEILVHGYGALLQAVIDEMTLGLLTADVTSALSPYSQKEGLIYPMEAILLQIKK